MLTPLSGLGSRVQELPRTAQKATTSVAALEMDSAKMGGAVPQNAEKVLLGESFILIVSVAVGPMVKYFFFMSATFLSFFWRKAIFQEIK